MMLHMFMPESIATLSWFILFFVILTPYNPKTTDDFLSSYDYIVIGAGSAGSVVASRLSEDSCVKVLLLEAGPEADARTELPIFSVFNANTQNDWNYTSVPQKRGAYIFKDQKLYLTRGNGLGGCSIMYDMFYVRGNKKDFDSWAKHGATGWAWEDVFPYFLKSEDNTDPAYRESIYHNRGGYLTVSSAQYTSQIMTAFAKAAPERGYEYIDTNGEKQTGFSKFQTTIRKGRRCSCSKAFLIPAENRKNLHIVKNALVTKVLINNNKEAYGVAFEHDNRQHEVHAHKEVIVSGGTYNTPQILMLSGIGPKRHLRQLGIKVVKDLPVGNNLQNHFGMPFIHFEVPNVKNIYDRLKANVSESIIAYNVYGTGLISSSATEGVAFINSKFNDPSWDWPDITVVMPGFVGPYFVDGAPFTKEVYNQVYGPYSRENTFTVAAGILKPKSRGTVRLKSANPRDYPLIDPNIFQFEEDLEVMVDAMKEAIKIITDTKAFQDLGAKLFQTKFPFCGNYTIYSDEYLRCMGRFGTIDFGHATSTCKMGRRTDKAAVVDSRLRVIGVKNLRVVDGSVMPNVTTGNTNAPIIMIAEKASDMIKEDNRHTYRC